jgi:hypothetical protein
MEKQITIDYDEYIELEETRKNFEKIIKNCPKQRLDIYGFLSDREIIILNSKEDLDKIFNSYIEKVEKASNRIRLFEKYSKTIDLFGDFLALPFTIKICKFFDPDLYKKIQDNIYIITKREDNK